MKEYSVSHSTAPPISVKVVYDPSADELMTDWLSKRVQKAIELVVAAAARTGVAVKDISVFGTDYYDNSYRQIFIWINVDAPDDEAYDYWGIVARPVHGLNQPPPAGAENADVRLEVSVSW